MSKSYTEFTLINFLELAQPVVQPVYAAAPPQFGAPPINGAYGNAGIAQQNAYYQPQLHRAYGPSGSTVEQAMSRITYLHPHIEEKEAEKLSADANLSVALDTVGVSQVWMHQQRVEGVELVESKWVNDVRTTTVVVSGQPVLALVFTRGQRQTAVKAVELESTAAFLTIEISHVWTIVDRRTPAPKPRQRPRPVREAKKND